jgi:methylglutaconyl-CoA hydratase
MTAALHYIRVSGSPDVPVVTLSRADVRNALNAEMIAELTAVLKELAMRNEVRALILAADGETFCSGADFHWMKSQQGASPEENIRDAERAFDLFETMYRFPCPTIARVQGDAYGGGAGIIACCDIVVMAENAALAFSEVRIGLIPAMISPFVIRKIGTGRAREFFLTGMPISAQRAYELSLANRVVVTAGLDEAVADYTKALLRNGPQAVRNAKRLIDEVTPLTLSAARELTTRRIAEQRVSPEGQEGMAAFLEKRKPAWQN